MITKEYIIELTTKLFLKHGVKKSRLSWEEYGSFYMNYKKSEWCASGRSEKSRWIEKGNFCWWI